MVEDVGDIEIEDDDLQIDTYRASGAGGQHVNKTDSAVRITHRPSGIVVQCQNERSQSANKDTAMKMLRAKLLEREEAKRREEIAAERGEAQDVNFGSQIRSYVLHPYTMVKDHRTSFEVGRRPARARRRPRRLRSRRAHAHRRPRMTEQPAAPYLDAVIGYGTRGPGRFHVPGHKGGQGADPGLRFGLGDRALWLDIPQDIWGVDLGPSPTPYEEAERLAAEAHGAARTWFLTNGATQGNHALCLALAPLGAHVVAQRNSHASLVDGLVLSGGVPAFVPPEYDAELGMAHGVEPAALERRAGRARPRRGRRSSSRRPTTGWRPTSARAPRWPTPRACRSSSTSPGARTSASTRRCRPAGCRRAPTPCSRARTRSRAR